jgi:tetratricopeptide (TPR) repeat protein
MTATWLRIIGLTLSLLYATFIVWLYARQPKTVAEVTGGITASVGVYQIDRASFDEGLRFFRADHFPEARSAFARADTAKLDATTQFYIAYSFVRQGWGRVYSDDGLYQEAKRTLEHAVAVAPQHKIIVDDAGLSLKSSDELKAEIDRGLTRDSSDLNPLRLFRERP